MKVYLDLGFSVVIKSFMNDTFMSWPGNLDNGFHSDLDRVSRNRILVFGLRSRCATAKASADKPNPRQTRSHRSLSMTALSVLRIVSHRHT